MSYDIDINLYRSELTLNRSGIRNSFGTDGIEVLYKIDDLREKYLNYIDREVITPIKEHLEQEIYHIEKLIVDCNYKTMECVYKSICDDLIDIILLGIAGHNVYRQKSNYNFTRDFNRLLKSISRKHIGRYPKIINILSGMRGKKIQLLSVPITVEKCLKTVM